MERQERVNITSSTKNIMFFGRTGCGKSTTCNTLFKYLNQLNMTSTRDEENPFAVSDMPESCTADITSKEVRGFQIIDGPGYSDTSKFTDCELELLYKDFIGAVLEMSEVHAFVFVERETRWNPEILHKLCHFFGGDRFIKSLLIIKCHSEDAFINHQEKFQDFLLAKIKSDPKLSKLDSSQLLQWDNKIVLKEESKKHLPLMTTQIDRFLKLISDGILVKPYVKEDLNLALENQKLSTTIEKKATSAEKWLKWIAYPIVALFAPIITLPFAFIALAKLKSLARSSRHLKSSDLKFGGLMPANFLSHGDRIEKLKNPSFYWDTFDNEKIQSLVWLCYNRYNLFWCIINLPKEANVIPTPCDEKTCPGKIIIPFYGPPESLEGRSDEILFVVSGISTTISEDLFKKPINEVLVEISKVVVESRIYKAYA